MKIAVYAIAKNEEYNISDWYNSVSKADYHLILDTGSTDKTVEIAKSLGINVFSCYINPWDETLAKNIALSLLPENIDLCLMLDLDQVVMEKDWVSIIKNNNIPEDKYLFNVNFQDINKTYKEKYTLLHKRTQCYWEKYRPRITTYLENMEPYLIDISIIHKEGNISRYEDRNTLYTNAWEIEYKKIKKNLDIMYFLEIVAHQSLTAFELSDINLYSEKKQEFFNIYNDLQDDQKNEYLMYFIRFELIDALVYPENSIEILEACKSRIYEKKDLLWILDIINNKLLIIKYLFNNQNCDIIIPEINCNNLEQALFYYSDILFGNYRIDLAKKSFEYFNKKNIGA